MIIVKLTNPMSIEGLDPSSVSVAFFGNDPQQQSLPTYGRDPAFKLDWIGEPDKQGAMRFNSISAAAFAEIAAAQHFIVEIVEGSIK